MTNNDPTLAFAKDCQDEIAALGRDADLQRKALDWAMLAARHKYVFHFSWMGRPIIQYPQDMVAMQELIWLVRPDLVIETGIAHGGSLVLYASLLSLLDMCDAIESGASFNPRESKRAVLGIDIDIRHHNRVAIEGHPMASRIHMIQGSSIAPDVVGKVRQFAADYKSVLVVLDSNHTHEHVLAELEAYAPLVSVGSYCVVFDTVIEDMPKAFYPDRPWGPGNNPKTAVWKYVASHPEFEIDKHVEHKLLLTVAPDGYVRRIR